MDYLYNYGISQEDVWTEIKVLDLSDSDSLLCIASAGEIPLNIASLFDVKIKATDISGNQLKLCRIKQVAGLHPDTLRSASFLGYMNMERNERGLIFRNEIAPHLSEEDRIFWEKNSDALKSGVVNVARFESFIHKAAYIGRFIIGSKNLYSLFECDSTKEQAEIFERKIKGFFLKGMFKVTFHPTIYKNRGIDPAGLTHSGARNIAEFFFHRFRNFCCSTLSRRNYFLQYTFFNKVLFPEAMPEFLQPSFHDKFVKNYNNIEYVAESIDKILSDEDSGKFNKLHISNIGDWQSEDKMKELFRLINNKTAPGTRISMRYIHFNHKIPADLPSLEADYSFGRTLEQSDRYPFYTIVPLIRK
jgi:S-adenosylmethionine:diacylglycerol 3-amino-3-carboxypropyl transferase